MTSKLLSEKKVGGITAILVGGVSFYEAIKLYPLSKNLLTGDHAFPGLIGILLMLFGLGVSVDRNIESTNTRLPTGKERLHLLLTISILLIYCFLISLVGYVVSTWVVSIALIKMIGNYRWLYSALFGTATTIVLYYLFIVLLKIPFPTGYFSF
ncbi:tripartite tricarboxylate transporter TctB family protein [Bacillus tuaregi]|uniref:tripartite tricarboxylate transporter TctB family protein n=1 Tax=Bacillus tuaregi TaxID=1816695 RepID=UPI0008F82917|nr:tripartite tricarboxylate transporter TctB family protein [Bacillus tuaregi]